jgi:hypothetical protein
MADKIDLIKDLKPLYQPPSKEPVIVTIPALDFLMLDGSGDPNTSPAYAEAVQSLYQMAYTLKFAIKKATGADFAVMPLEGLWWAEDMGTFQTRDKSAWSWRMMIAQPSLVTPDWFETAKKQALSKKDAASRIAQIRLESYDEGLCVQLMHIGPYDAEAPNIERIHAHALQQGFHLAGLHHEIYLSDPRRSAPEKMRTIIRQPIAR